ncbi:MAG: hypothetical protein WCJ35_03370 [Planctomycetota bacterium]
MSVETIRKSPLQAVKQYCRECSGDSYTETQQCHITNCPLYQYRLGKTGRTRAVTPDVAAAAATRLAAARAARKAK